MKNIFLATLIFSLIASSSAIAGEEKDKKEAKQSSQLYGLVMDQANGENLAGVEIRVENTNIVCYSDLEGKFSINDLEPGKYNLILSYISYNESFVENVDIEVGEQKELTVHLVAQKE
ncbi:MAG: carboxypeptidase-like regulatory domain-containing protein [Bacteroidales bacterium]